MVTNRKKHSEKTPVKQGPEEIAPEPNKINGSTPYDFNGKNLTPYGGAAAGDHHAGETRIPVPGGTDRNLEADSSCHGPVSICAGDCARPLHRLSAAEPIALRRARPDLDGHPQGHQTAGA